MEAIDRLTARVQQLRDRLRARFALVDIVLRTFERASEDDASTYAAALTYYTFLSVFPLLLFGAAILGFVSSLIPEVKTELVRDSVDAVPLMRDVLKPDGLDYLQRQKRTFAVTGFVLSLYSGSGGIVALEHALNKIARVRHEPNWITKRLRSLRWLGLLGLAGIATVGLSAYAGLDTSPSERDFASASEGVRTILGHVAAGVINLAVFASAFKLLPARTRSWREVLPGALVAAVLFELLKVVGTLIIESGSRGREAAFGAFALAASLLLASYLLAQVTLLAAELNEALAERSGRGPRREERGNDG